MTSASPDALGWAPKGDFPPLRNLAVPSVADVYAALSEAGNAAFMRGLLGGVLPRIREGQEVAEARVYAAAALQACVRRLSPWMPDSVFEGRWAPRAGEQLGGAECRLIVCLGALIRDAGDAEVNLDWVADFAAEADPGLDPEARVAGFVQAKGLASPSTRRAKILGATLAALVQYEVWVRSGVRILIEAPAAPAPLPPLPPPPRFPAARAFLGLVSREALLLAEGPFALTSEVAAAELSRVAPGWSRNDFPPRLGWHGEALARAASAAGLSEQALADRARAWFRQAGPAGAGAPAGAEAEIPALFHRIRCATLANLAARGGFLSAASCPAADRSPFPERYAALADDADVGEALEAILRLQREAAAAGTAVRGWVLAQLAFEDPAADLSKTEGGGLPAAAAVAALGRAERLRQEAVFAKIWLLSSE